MIFDPRIVIESPALRTDAANAIPAVSISEFFYQFTTVVHKFLYKVCIWNFKNEKASLEFYVEDTYKWKIILEVNVIWS